MNISPISYLKVPSIFPEMLVKPKQSCFKNLIDRIVDFISRIFRCLACKMASSMGYVAHGNLSNNQLRDKMNRTVLSASAKRLLDRSYKGLKSVFDCHLHILGYDQGNYLNPGLNRGLSGMKWSVIHCAATGSPYSENSTELAKERLHIYVEHFPQLNGIILPIHPAFKEDGTVDLEKTDSALDNTVALAAKKEFTNGSGVYPAVSIHPLDPLWMEKMIEARDLGISIIKWYPSQGIDPSLDKWGDFYLQMANLKMTLLAHSGCSHAGVGVREWQEYGHPKNFAEPLKKGVTVILAHSGHTEHFDDFLKLSDKVSDEKWSGKLYGDLSATLHEGPAFLKRLLIAAQKPGVSFLYGSDYPYTNLAGRDHYADLVTHGMLPKELLASLKEIHGYNPLLANFVAFRNMYCVVNGEKLYFPDAVFAKPV